MARIKNGEARAAFFFLLPALAVYLLFALVPTLAAFVLSFSEMDRMTGSVDFVGLANYQWIWTDPRFWRTFANAFLFIILAVTGNVGIGLLLALIVNRKMPAVVLYFLRLSFFMPVLVACAFVSIIWQFLYSQDLGVINYYLRLIGIPAVGWLTDNRVAMVSVVIMDVWKNTGFFMLILLAALQDVPREVLEAAKIDGAGRLAVFFRITLPQIMPVVFFCIAYATIGGLQVFDSIRILTNGGPGDATRSVVMYMYEETFNSWDVGTGSAAACTLLVVIGLVTAGQIWVGKRWLR